VRNIFSYIIILIFSGVSLFAQNNALILNGGVKVNITNGAVLSINQPNPAGIVVTGAGTSYIQSEGETNRVAWHINAGTGNYVIPFGVGSTDTKIDMSYNVITSGSVSGTLVASTFATANDNTLYPSSYTPAVSNMNLYGSGSTDYSLYAADRFWILRKENWSTNPVSILTLTYRDIEFAPANSITESSLLAQYWDNTLWNPTWISGTALLGVNDAANNQVNSINAGSGNFYTWILSGISTSLPIELLSLKTRCDGNSNPVIEWETASETNNDYFTLERSYDGLLWTTVSVIPGAGNSNSPLYYIYTDNNAPDGILLYQLTQTDFDGMVSNVGMASINCEEKITAGSYNMHIYSDNEDIIHVTFVSPDADPVVLKLFDMRGRLVYKENLVPLEGFNHFALDLIPLENAIYLINLTGTARSENKKFLRK